MQTSFRRESAHNTRQTTLNSRFYKSIIYIKIDVANPEFSFKVILTKLYKNTIIFLVLWNRNDISNPKLLQNGMQCIAIELNY